MGHRTGRAALVSDLPLRLRHCAAEGADRSTSPTFSNAMIGWIVMIGALVAFTVTALVLWLAIYVVVTLRRLVARGSGRISS
jgi:large-conductance mechanosensitive channel